MGTLLDEMMDETKKNIAINLLEKGKMTYEEIAECTGLTVDEVEELDG